MDTLVIHLAFCLSVCLSVTRVHRFIVWSSSSNSNRWSVWRHPVTWRSVTAATEGVKQLKHVCDDFATLCSAADKQLFNRILNQPEHVLHPLLPPPSASQYNLRHRPHNRLLCQSSSRLTDCNFILRKLYCDMYWLTLRIFYCFVFFACGSAFWHFCN